MDGRTDIDSDIDVMKLIPGSLYHLKGHCKCDGIDEQQQVEYKNGHILCHGYDSSPAIHFHGSSLRPAFDYVRACRLCCYPPIAPLLSPRVTNSNIPETVLQSLQRELTHELTPCHVVHAAAPGQAGKQLRVSTSFLEKRLLQSLSTLQGQLFVTLKYLVKKEISGTGVKTYHAKTIMFRMLEETPADKWKPENLLNLTRQSLEMMLDSVESNSDRTDGRIMDHFFLCDAALYMKGQNADGSSSRRIVEAKQSLANAVRNVINDLPNLLMQFIHSLRADLGAFHFHPFLILLQLQEISVTKNTHLKYHEIYDVVRESLVQLSQVHCDFTSLTEMIGRLPDCARTAREALRVLACLKFDDLHAAVKVLKDNRGCEVSRSIAWSAERSKADATQDFVWQHLWDCDSAWKFCFYFDQRPSMMFLPTCLAKCFPVQMQNDSHYFYFNFDALLKCLHIVLMTGDVSAQKWFMEIIQSDEDSDADGQELLAVIELAKTVR